MIYYVCTKEGGMKIKMIITIINEEKKSKSDERLATWIEIYKKIKKENKNK